ncbi:MAG: hypothetical protein NUV82_02670 [Candidatus Komeilibacteria bacterium]|nr:hypothetical protein [Candidatus Komeilibacteria bacterium]
MNKYLASVIVVCCLNLSGCYVEDLVAPQSETIIIVYSSDSIAVYEVGHIQLLFNFKNLTARSITITNGNDRAIGVDIRDRGNAGIVILSDSWIGGGKSVTKQAVFYENQEIAVRLVVYKSMSQTISDFIAALGDGFWDKLEDTWVDIKYERNLIIKL